MHLITIDDLSLDDIDGILTRARTLAAAPPPPTLAGKVAALLFLQPSTRTRIGFQAAMGRLGGTPIEVTHTKYAPEMSEPESLADTITVVSAYADLLIIRSASRSDLDIAQEKSVAPVLNAGCASEDHPTQTLIDLYALQQQFGTLTGLRIGMVGDLCHSRSARSLVRALHRYPPTELRLISPRTCTLPDDTVSGLPVRAIDDLQVEGLDVLYVCGLPERYGDVVFPLAVRQRFQVTLSVASHLPAGAMILCPLPRIDEITRAVDLLPQASYFQQSANGLFVRMAILEHWVKPFSHAQPDDNPMHIH